MFTVIWQFMVINTLYGVVNRSIEVHLPRVFLTNRDRVVDVIFVGWVEEEGNF